MTGGSPSFPTAEAASWGSSAKCTPADGSLGCVPFYRDEFARHFFSIAWEESLRTQTQVDRSLVDSRRDQGESVIV